MAISNHALSQMTLGPYRGAEHVKVDSNKWETIFYYDYGVVLLSPDWKYKTILDKDAADQREAPQIESTNETSNSIQTVEEELTE